MELPITPVSFRTNRREPKSKEVTSSEIKYCPFVWMLVHSFEVDFSLFHYIQECPCALQLRGSFVAVHKVGLGLASFHMT